MDNKIKNQKIVCLGGGIGTVNLISGLKNYTDQISVIISGADDGGSSGRLRRKFDIFPPGDGISCLASLIDDSIKENKLLLTYRFPGKRYAGDSLIDGHKTGSLLFVAAYNITGSVIESYRLLSKIFGAKGEILPATSDKVTLAAHTIDNLYIEREEVIDLGKYKGKQILDKVMISPENPDVPEQTIESIMDADTIIVGPGDLYTTLLPVLIVPRIQESLIKSKAKKIFIVNVANKPFETKGYTVSDFINAIKKHLHGEFPFETVIYNNNISIPIPKPYKYHYVLNDPENIHENIDYICEDLVDADFPLYHDHAKLASLIIKHI